MVTTTPTRPVGDLLRDWRRRRRLSQLELALDADVSTRHLSFVETGRSQPSRGMLLRLAERLDVPLRERNDLLIAAGYAPVYSQRSIDAPEMGPARQALNRVLDGHEPYPALVVDRFWNLVMANNAAMLFLEGVPDELVRPPVNVHRLALHPDGLASRVVNLPEVRAHLVARMARQVALTGDPELAALHEETRAYGPDVDEEAAHQAAHDIALPTILRYGGEVLSFFSTVTTFGAAADVTLAELAVEAFFPADDETAAVLRRRAETGE
ncbi:helix-turn-helix transcriptional regulator [Actinoallomurus spadix]|uniref:Helix-turn-helix transcriptional regulator n=1 Tax=Actinoallomurus spadix TaxID=79912 RepID=A0ABP3G8M9_9ACTN|nr:helix-turn-helix transcriptional regulator [Actinoallomurus spadix]MCO5989861.1 helix-turn-helix transcriptional regulator [Actinoallomurus spadix]